jgi:hypothetical protein
MDKERIYRIDETDQGLPSGRIRVEQSRRRGSLRDRVIYLLRAICIAAVGFLGAGVGTFPAFGDGFEYRFPSPGTGTVTSGSGGVSFSGVSLHNVTQGPAIPGTGWTLFGPFPNNAPDHFISFSVFAPGGFHVDVNRSTLSVSVAQAVAIFSVSAPGTSQEIQVRFGHNPNIGDTLPLPHLTGSFTLRPITIRYYPREGFTKRMVGGVFEGTNGDPVTGPYEHIHQINDEPPLAWSSVSVSLGNYRYLRYRGADGSFGNVAEIEFWRNYGEKLTGADYGTPGSWNNGGETFAKALDGDISTSFDGPTPDGCYVGIDTGTPLPATYALTVNSGSGTGNYLEGASVKVTADAPPFGQEFAGWTGDIAILSNPFIPTTTATIPRMGVTIAATYSAVTGSDKIRYYPRAGFTERMVGGVFEGTNGDPLTGTYTGIYTITTNPPLAWSEVGVSLGNYRYLRYRGPNGSYGNVSELEFYRSGVRVTGVDFGTAGSWSNSGSTRDKALDGNVNTFFDSPTENGAYVGIDTGTGEAVSGDKIRYYPRSGFAERMVGGVFEGTNGDSLSGSYTTIYTVTSSPPLAWTEVSASLGNYRYLRYRGPNGSYGNVSELEFYRNGVKVTGADFGTLGSWSNNGSTRDKALDGNVNTFFDAPTENGAYVGIDTQ